MEKKVNEGEFYEPLKEWLESEGYRALITAGKRQVLLTTGSLLGVISYLEPDVVGYRREGYVEYLVIVEAKADPMHLLDGLGRCCVYQLVADYVYLALSKVLVDKIGPGSLYEELGVGVLSVSGKDVQVKVKAQEKYTQRYELRKVLMDIVKASLGIGE